ncbi:MAG: hypothetical protein WCH93_01955, partial [Actinomycetota bacterium]
QVPGDRCRTLQEEVTQKFEDKKPPVITAAIAGGLLLLLAFYVLGRRSGRKRSALVQIRRV